jgi:hypothetical protein
MELVGNGTADGGIELGSRYFSPLDGSDGLSAYVESMLGQIGIDGPVGQAIATTTLHAFSLFASLGKYGGDISVKGHAADGHFILEITNGLDFHKALVDEGGRLTTTNLDLTSLVAFLDEVHIGRTDDGRTILRLAVELPGTSG